MNMKSLLKEWRQKFIIKEATHYMFPTVNNDPDSPEDSLFTLSNMVNDFSGKRFIFFDIETIGSTFGNYKERNPKQISELYAEGITFPQNYNQDMIFNRSPELNISSYHVLANLTDDVLRKREEESSLTFDQAVAAGHENLEDYYREKYGKMQLDKPWNIQDYIDYTHRESDEMQSIIDKGEIMQKSEKDLIEGFISFISNELQTHQKIYIAGHNIIEFDNNFILTCADKYPDLRQSLYNTLHSQGVTLFDTLRMAQSVTSGLIPLMHANLPDRKQFFDDEFKKINTFGQKSIIGWKHKGVTTFRNSMDSLRAILALRNDMGSSHTAVADVKDNIAAFFELCKVIKDIDNILRKDELGL